MKKKSVMRYNLPFLMIFTFSSLFGVHIFAQNDLETNYAQPNDFSYFEGYMGYVNSPVDDAVNAPDEFSGYYYAFWGAYRFSLVDFLFQAPPKYRFHIRDIIDVQGGVGYGSDLYTNLSGGVGLKFKYDFSQDLNFGMNVGFRAGQDHIPFYGFYGQPFIRYKEFFGQVGFGSNVNDKTALGNQRKFTTINVKYFLQPDSPKSNYISFAVNIYSGRNKNPNHEWERNSQVMVGVGRQLGN